MDLIINILAVIKSGAAYVPIEPSFPRERINHIIEHSPAKYALVQEEYVNVIKNEDIIVSNDVDLSEYSDSTPKNVNSEKNALYVLYTSGTTGEPKGVVVEHRNVFNYIQAFKKEFDISENDKMLQNSTVTFDIFTEEFYPVLTSGGTLVIAPEDHVNNAERLVNLINKENISFMTSFPYLLSDFNNLVEKGLTFLSPYESPLVEEMS